MKRWALYIAMAVFAMSATAQRQARVTTDIKGLSSTDTLTIQWEANNKSVNPYIMQRGAIGDSAFVIPLNEPRLIVLGLKDATCRYELLVSPGEEIRVEGRTRKMVTTVREDVQFRKMTVIGAQYQPRYEAIINEYQHHIDSIDTRVYNEYKDVTKLIEKAKENNDEQAIAEMYQTLHGQSYIDRVMSTFAEREDFLKAIVSKQKDSFFGPLILLRLAGRLNKDHKPLYDEMSAEAKQSYYGREVKDEVDPPTLLGDLAPTVTVTDTTGVERVLSFSEHGNRYLLLDFWASWCQPCHKEVPNLKRIYNKYHALGLDIIGISADHSEEDWKEAIEELEESWTNYIDTKRQAIGEYKVQFIPSIFIVDKEGRIIAEKLRGKELSDFVDKLFAE